MPGEMEALSGIANQRQSVLDYAELRQKAIEDNFGVKAKSFTEYTKEHFSWNVKKSAIIGALGAAVFGVVSYFGFGKIMPHIDGRHPSKKAKYIFSGIMAGAAGLGALVDPYLKKRIFFSPDVKKEYSAYLDEVAAKAREDAQKGNTAPREYVTAATETPSDNRHAKMVNASRQAEATSMAQGQTL